MSNRPCCSPVETRLAASPTPPVICHAERSMDFTKWSPCGVEAPLRPPVRQGRVREFSPCSRVRCELPLVVRTIQRAIFAEGAPFLRVLCARVGFHNCLPLRILPASQPCHAERSMDFTK